MHWSIKKNFKVILKNFQLVKIDGNVDYYKKKGLTIVPTIKVIGYSKSFMGQECFEWLKTIISTLNKNNITNSPINIGNRQNQMENNSINKQSNKTITPPIINKNASNPNNENLKNKKLDDMGYRPGEMNGISDTYAYKDIDAAFPMSFQTRNSNSEIYTPPIEKNKIEKNKQVELIKKIELSRNNDKNEFIKNAEEERNKYN